MNNTLLYNEASVVDNVVGWWLVRAIFVVVVVLYNNRSSVCTLL